MAFVPRAGEDFPRAEPLLPQAAYGGPLPAEHLYESRTFEHKFPLKRTAARAPPGPRHPRPRARAGPPPVARGRPSPRRRCGRCSPGTRRPASCRRAICEGRGRCALPSGAAASLLRSGERLRRPDVYRERTAVAVGAQVMYAVASRGPPAQAPVRARALSGLTAKSEERRGLRAAYRSTGADEHEREEV